MSRIRDLVVVAHVVPPVIAAGEVLEDERAAEPNHDEDSNQGERPPHAKSLERVGAISQPFSQPSLSPAVGSRRADEGRFGLNMLPVGSSLLASSVAFGLGDQRSRVRISPPRLRMAPEFRRVYCLAA